MTCEKNYVKMEVPMNNTIEYQEIQGNRNHKDSLFRKVFRKKSDLLSLYNAINGTDYDNEDDLEINTLDSALYMTVKNDVSCIVGCTMNLYEHQSSYNPNMPLRGLIYFSTLYNIYVEQRKLNLFSTTLQKIPTPQFVVFYNGLKNEPDRQVLRLSDAFQTKGGCLECEAVMLNINYGQNRELLEKCRRLEEYAIFIATVREYAMDKKLSLSTAITLAIDACIEKGILLDILRAERTEVFMYILESFDKELYERDLKQNALDDGKQVGMEAGRKEGKNETLISMIKIKLNKGKTVQQIADEMEQTVEVIETLMLEMDK